MFTRKGDTVLANYTTLFSFILLEVFFIVSCLMQLKFFIRGKVVIYLRIEVRKVTIRVLPYAHCILCTHRGTVSQKNHVLNLWCFIKSTHNRRQDLCDRMVVLWTFCISVCFTFICCVVPFSIYVNIRKGVTTKIDVCNLCGVLLSYILYLVASIGG